MAVIETDGAIIRGKMGAITFAYRRGTNYSRAYGKGHDPKTPAQLAQRARYGEFQRLGSLWNKDFITPYFQGDRNRELPFNSFIKYNWARWDKVTPPWKSAIPFWDVPQSVTFGSAPFPGDTHDKTPVKIIADIPASLSRRGVEFYGFYTRGEAARFVKLAPCETIAEGWNAFDTGVNCEDCGEDIHAVCWLQMHETVEPLCMPSNRRMTDAPSAEGWDSYSCALTLRVSGSMLTVSLFSDIPAQTVGRENAGWTRCITAGDIVLGTFPATPDADGAGRAAHCDIDISAFPAGEMYVSAWFQNARFAIPVSQIAKGNFAK